MINHEGPASAAGLARRVVLSGVPVRRFLQLHDHLDALVDELGVIAVPGQPGCPELDRLMPLYDGLTGQYAEARRGSKKMALQARTAGRRTFTLEAMLPPDAAAGVALFNQLLDSADAAASSGMLLTAPAPPDVVDVRRWIGAEIVAAM